MAAEESCWALLCFALLWGQFCYSNTKGLKCNCQSGCGKKGRTLHGSGRRIVNVAYNKEAKMSSYHDRDGGSGPACAAVNGRTGTRWKKNNCVHTQDGDLDAWWQVDLGHKYTVTDITIYRRRDAPRRMAGGSVYVDDQLCYSFPNSTNTNALDQLLEKIEITCTPPLNGQVVRFQKHGQDTGGEFYHINICEVQVWACRPGLYESSCEKTCSGNCKNKNTCDNYYGTCPTGCMDGHYGYDCAQQCGQCTESDTCNTMTGQCPRGCDPGWTTHFCDQSCSDGHYGYDCAQQCGQCMESDTCNTVNGECSRGCDPGWTTPFCNQSCPEGLYGHNCMYQCPNCTQVERCDKVSGTCLARCARGLDSTDPICRQRYHDDTKLVLFCTIPGVLVIAVVLLLIFFLRRRRKKSDSKPASTRSKGSSSRTDPASTRTPTQDQDHPESRTPPSHIPDPKFDGGVPLAGNDHVYANENEGVYAGFKARKPRLDPLQKYLVDRLASGKLKAEFWKIESSPVDVPQEAGLLPQNAQKNRFRAIVPYDHCRVVLNDNYTQDGATDFINASYVSGYRSAKQYIAAQGPRDTTVGDLWRMVWQEKMTHIIMLTNVTESGKDKCKQYWPEEMGGREKYGPVTVTTTHVQRRDAFFIRTFTIARDGRNETREVTQYHYVSWPDHGAPNTTSLVSFWRHVTNRTKASGEGCRSYPPVLIHCSAGVGRTGTYIGLDIGMDMAVTERHVDVLGLVHRLRKERCLMVQAFDQYVFLHKSLLEAYTAQGTNMSVERFESIFPAHETIHCKKPYPLIDNEFETLKQMLKSTPDPRHDTATLQENIEKNRNPQALPSEEHLVYLTEHVKDRNQYINAVYMPTFRDAQGSIVTQLPLPSTLVDFWRLVYGNDVTTIVSLSSPTEEQEVKPYCQYWPTKGGVILNIDPYSITLQSKTAQKETKITVYNLNLSKKGAGPPRFVKLLHYKGWMGEVGGNTSDILHLVHTLMTSQADTSNHRLVVQCSDGVSKSGLFCTLCDIINRMTYDRGVDVYMTVRQVQHVAPKAVTSAVQYRYCYEIAQKRVREKSVYANS